LPVPGGPKNNIPFTGCQHESGTSMQWVINLHNIFFSCKNILIYLLITQYPAVKIILKSLNSKDHNVFIRAPS
jgi:hypothetical protein